MYFDVLPHILLDMDHLVIQRFDHQQVSVIVIPS